MENKKNMFEEFNNDGNPPVKYLFKSKNVSVSENKENRKTKEIEVNNKIINMKKYIIYDSKTGKYSGDIENEKILSYEIAKKETMKKMDELDIKRFKKVFKYMDFQLYNILMKMQEEGRIPQDACNKYIYRLFGLKMGNLPFKVCYDLSNLSNSKLTFKEKLKIKRIANRAEKYGYARVIHDKSIFQKVKEFFSDKIKLKRLAAGIGATGLLLTGTAMTSNTSKDDKVDLESKNNITMETDTNTRREEFEKRNKLYFKGNDDVQQNNNVGKIENKEIDNKEKNIEAVKQIKTGDVVFLEDGVKYYANSIKEGKETAIGDLEWRKSGEYTIDGIAVVLKNSDGKLKLLQSSYDKLGVDRDEYVNSVLKKYNIDLENIEVMYHVSKGKYNKSNKEENGDKEITGWITRKDAEYLNNSKVNIDEEER